MKYVPKKDKPTGSHKDVSGAKCDLNEQIVAEGIEDVTLYGEFISSFDQWTTMDRQREVTNFLEEITAELSPDTVKTNPGTQAVEKNGSGHAS